MTCSECEEDMMYKRRHGERCANCGHIKKPKTGLIDQYPTKPHDAVCGEELNGYPKHDDTYPKLIEPLCNDDSQCSFNPTTIKRNGRDVWLAVCTTHDS